MKNIIILTNNDDFYIQFDKRVKNYGIKEELELLEMLEEAEKDVKNGRTSSVEEMFDEIRKKLNLLDKLEPNS